MVDTKARLMKQIKCSKDLQTNFQTFLRPCALLFGFKFEGMQHGILYVQKAHRLFNKGNGQ